MKLSKSTQNNSRSHIAYLKFCVSPNLIIHRNNILSSEQIRLIPQTIAYIIPNEYGINFVFNPIYRVHFDTNISYMSISDNSGTYLSEHISSNNYHVIYYFSNECNKNILIQKCFNISINKLLSEWCTNLNLDPFKDAVQHFYIIYFSDNFHYAQANFNEYKAIL